MSADYWKEHEKYPHSDWRIEVENGDTLAGYWQWVEARIDMTATDEAEKSPAPESAPQLRTQHDADCARRFLPSSECTCGFNEETEWTRALQAGAQVKWNDPDGGICSRVVTIGSIEQDRDDYVTITVVSGDCIEALRSELSQISSSGDGMNNTARS